MRELSLDYADAVSGLPRPLEPALVGAALLDAFALRYAEQVADCSLLELSQSGATYLFDHAGAEGLPQEDRTIGAWTLTPDTVRRRDVSYQRGYPMAPGIENHPVDRGHLIAHLSGGEFGPNIFRQDRALNRGWSDEGKRYRALEREAAAVPGTFYFGHLVYGDDSAYPLTVETGVLRDGALHVESFDNQPWRHRTDP
jgi:hypothetical protein